MRIAEWSSTYWTLWRAEQDFGPRSASAAARATHWNTWGGAGARCFFEESATITCIIEYGVRPAMEGTLGEAFAVLVSEFQAIDGFISMDDFQSQTRPQRGEF